MIKKISLLFLASLIFTLSPVTTYAQNRAFYEANDVLFYDPNSDIPINCAPSLTGPIPGEDNLQKIFNFLLSKGASKKVAAAMVGNIYQESKGDPLLRQGGSRTDKPELVGIGKGPYINGRTFTNSPGDRSVGDAWGILQWDPGHAALYWQKQAGVSGDITKLETQLEVTWWHLKNLSPTSRRNMLAQAENKSSVEEATEYLVGFWGPSKPMTQSRISAAVRAMSYPVDPSLVVTEQLVNSDVCVSDGSGGGGGGDSSSGGGGNVDSTLSSGGLTEAQARRFVMHYGANKNNSSRIAMRNNSYWDYACRGSGKGSNCVSFVRFFLLKFTDQNYTGSFGDGKDVVKGMASRGVPTGKEPRVGAIFSIGGSGYGHTGVVLGIHGDRIIVGHASCDRGQKGKQGEGDGTVDGSGSGFVLAGPLKGRPNIWWQSGGWNSTLTFAYPKVNMDAVSKYLETGV